MENNYPSNSDRGQENQNLPSTYQKRVTAPVVKGEVSQKERTFWNSFADFFGIGECRSFRDYVSALSDMTNRVYGAIDTLLGNRRYQNSSVPGARVQYSSYYNAPAQAAAQPTGQTQATQRSNIDQYGPYYIVYDLREDAEVVLARMIELLQLYRNASIDDMYDLAGITSPLGYSGANYGWRDLTNAMVRPYGSKFVIELPPVVPIHG